MNLKHPFDNAIAGKLKQLTPPDMEQSWQEMRRLLDEEDGRGAGGKRPPSGGWWKIGLVAVVLLCGSWWLLHTSGNNDQQLASAKTVAGNTETNQPVTTTTANPSNNQPIAQKSTLVSDNSNANTSNIPESTAAAANKAVVSRAPVTANPNAAGAVSTTTVAAVEPARTKAPATAEQLLNKPEKNAGLHKSSHAANTVHAQINTQPADNDNVALQSDLFNDNSGKKKLASHIKTTSTRPNNDASTTDAIYNSAALVSTATASRQWRADWSNGIMPDAPVEPTDFTANVAAPGNADSWTARELFNKETKLRVARAQRDQAAELAERKEKKKLHLDLSNLFKPFSLHASTDPWWSAGLALNSGVTVAAQNRFNYNVNAKSGVLLDYLPSPYLQFHINNYVYLQTEINFLTPQYTPQLLLYRSNAELSGQPGYSVEKSTYINKLYYFNWPFSLHYSPVSNLYFSAGLQFSSFQSGLATLTAKQYLTAVGADHPSSISSEILKFKDDSTAAKIKPNEWRWQVGAEYYINRFSVGMRYNQSLSKSINETVLPSLPPTVNRNQSLLFFIRYNLFDSKRKDNTGAANP